MTGRSADIVLDARMVTDGGIGTYLQQVVPRIAALRPAWRLTALGNEDILRNLGWDALPNVTVQTAAQEIFTVREQLVMPRLLGRSADLYWAPNYNVALLSRRPLLVTIHDVNHLALPELLGGRVRRTYSRWLLSTAVKRARRVIYDSEFTRSEATRELGNDAAAGAVIHLGVDSRWTRARTDFPQRPIAEPYFLYVGNIKRHKNVPLLIRAFKRAGAKIPHRLALIGRVSGLRADPEVARELESLGPSATLLGELSPDEVRRWMAHAEGLVTASLYEGFGLPALEAMAAGTPCILSRAGSLPEVAGDAALFADARDEQAFSEWMVELATNSGLREAMVQKGRARAATFSWARTAEATVTVIEQALEPQRS